MLNSALTQIPVDTILLTIALIVSLCVPFITTALNNAHNSKIYYLNKIDEEEAKAFREYLYQAGVVSSGESESFSDYMSAHYLAYLYAPDNARKLMDELIHPMCDLDLGKIEFLGNEDLKKLSALAEIFETHLSNLRKNKGKKTNN